MKARAIALLFLVMIITASIIGVFQSRGVMTSAQSAVGTELSKALGSLATIGPVEIESYNTLVVHDVVIFDKKTEKVISSEKVKITYNLFKALCGQEVMSAISEIVINTPTLWLTQESNGQWNIEGLLKQDKETKSTFAGKVTVIDGSAMLDTAGTKWSMDAINGKIDFANQPRVDLQLQAIHKGATLTAKGSIHSQGDSAVTITASELSLGDFQVFLKGQAVTLVGGTGKKFEVTITQKDDQLEWLGSISLAGADIDIDGMPLRQIQGDITFNNKKLYVFVKGNLFDQSLDVRGNIGIRKGEQVLDLAVRSDAFDPITVASNSPIKGQMAFRAKLTGVVSNPTISGEFSLPNGEIAGYKVSNAKANLSMADEKITIHQCTGNVLGGNVALVGTFEPAVGSYQLHLKGAQLEMNEIITFLPDFKGYGDIDVRVQGTGNLAAAEIQGSISLKQGKVAGVEFSSLGAGFYYNNESTTIDYVNMGIGQGMVTAKGAITQQHLNLMVYGQDIPLQELDKDKTGKISGKGGLIGQIGGTLSEPEFTAHVTANNGQAFYQPFTEAQGNLHINRQQVLLEDIELSHGVTKHTIKGTLNLYGPQEINIMVISQQARAENIVKLVAPGENITGNVNNEMNITGPLENVTIEGKLQLSDGSFRGRLIAKGEGFYKREQGVTTISQFSIDSLNTQIKLSGNISPKQELDFTIAAQDIDMASLNIKLPYTPVGRAQFNGKLTGTANNPIFNGQLYAATLTLNKQELKEVKGEIALSGNQIDIPYLSFTQGVGSYNAVGGFDMATHEIYGSFDVEKAELAPILAMLQLPDKGIHGQLNGHIRLTGTIDNPNAWITGSLDKGGIKQYPIDSLRIDVALENNVLKINDLSAMQGAGILMIRGTADLNGPLSLDVGGRDIDAGLIAAFFDTSLEPRGKMGFAAQVSGTAANPHAAISLEIADGGVGSTTFDSLYGLFIIDKNQLHVNQVLLKKGPYQASAYGTIPVAILNPRGREQSSGKEEMDLKLRLDEANLSILPLLTKAVDWAEGKTQGEIKITGTLEQPNMTGSITVNEGVIKLAALTSPIQKVGVDIRLEGDTISIKKFEGHLGKGWYDVTGAAKIRGMAVASYDVSLAINKPELHSKYFTGTIDGNLNLNNLGKQPKLSGKLLFENDTINIPAIPEMSPATYGVDLDVEVTVGKKVRFYNPYLYDIITEGQVHFAGSTLEPNFSGSIVAKRGTVNYLRTQFKVNEARLDFKQFASLQPIITLEAKTKLQQITVNLTLNGPVNEMQLGLTSEPAMRQQEILSLLTLRSSYIDKQNNGSTGGVGREELVSILGAGLQMQFFGAVESNFRSALGLDEFRLVQDTTSTVVKKSYKDHEETTTISQEVYNIEMSKYLNDKLLLSYTMGVNHDKNELALRYAFSKHTDFNTSIDNQQRTWLGFETRFRF